MGASAAALGAIGSMLVEGTDLHYWAAMGIFCFEMLVLRKKIELGGHQYSHRKLRRSSFLYYNFSHNCFEMQY